MAIYQVTDNEVKQRRYRVSREPELIYDGGEYYIARNWGKEGAEAFAHKISSKFNSITYKPHQD